MIAWRAGIVAVGLGLATCSSDDASPQQESCISTPEEYIEAWDDGLLDCVGDGLYVTITSGPDLYPVGFWYAWANSAANLEAYLELRARHVDDPVELVSGLTSYVGFPMKIVDGEVEATETTMVVYTLPDGEAPLVPTFATWFDLLGRLPDPIVVPPETQQALVDAYDRLDDGFDAVDAYSAVTGCAQLSPDQMLATGAFLGPGMTGCSADYTAALETAGSGPYDDGTTLECFAGFWSGGTEFSAAAIRAVLDRCQDVNPLNTAAGRGYNRNENPLVCAPLDEQTVTDRLTGPEFILANRPLAELPSMATITLSAPRGGASFLTEGYCS